MADSETVELLVVKFTQQIASEFGQDCGPGEEERVRAILRALAAEVERETRERAAKAVEKRGREIGGAIDPVRAARAIREEV